MVDFTHYKYDWQLTGPKMSATWTERHLLQIGNISISIYNDKSYDFKKNKDHWFITIVRWDGESYEELVVRDCYEPELEAAKQLASQMFNDLVKDLQFVQEF